MKFKTIKSPTTGKIWMDRNIGAKRRAKAIDDKKSYGKILTWDEAVDVCKKYPGFRLPTIKELKSENIQNSNDAFNKLKLPSAGDGFAYSQGSWGTLWSSSIESKRSFALGFHSKSTSKYKYNREFEFSVRLIMKRRPNK